MQQNTQKRKFYRVIGLTFMYDFHQYIFILPVLTLHRILATNKRQSGNTKNHKGKNKPCVLCESPFWTVLESYLYLNLHLCIQY